MSAGVLVFGAIILITGIGSLALAPYRRPWVIWVRLLLLLLLLMFAVFGFLVTQEVSAGRERTLFRFLYGSVITLSSMGLGLGVRALLRRP